MKVKQISSNIYKISFFFGMKLNVWVVKSGQDVYLIDTGMAFVADKILNEAGKLGNIKGIYITHGHSDHTGGIEAILKRIKIPVYMHDLDIPYTEGKKPYPGRKKAEKGIAENILLPLPKDENGALTFLEEVGLMPVHTPGHTPGHVVYWHKKNNVILAGDLFTSRGKNIRHPMKIFTGDLETAMTSGRNVIKLKPQVISMSHGDDIRNPYEQLERYN